jgi:hypothetical protein
LTDPKERNCYCTLWQTKPESLRERGIPEGFCGICDRCGSPGHVRHAPNRMPFTGCWCDRCYRIVSWTKPPALWIVYAIVVLLLLQVGVILFRR